MTPLWKEISRDLREIERETRIDPASNGQTFTWKSSTGAEGEIPCVPTAFTRGVSIDAEGNATTVDLKLIVRLDHWASFDSTLLTFDSTSQTFDADLAQVLTGRTLIFRGRTLRILEVRESALQSHYELSLADAASNR